MWKSACLKIKKWLVVTSLLEVLTVIRQQFWTDAAKSRNKSLKSLILLTYLIIIMKFFFFLKPLFKVINILFNLCLSILNIWHMSFMESCIQVLWHSKTLVGSLGWVTSVSSKRELMAFCTERIRYIEVHWKRCFKFISVL